MASSRLLHGVAALVIAYTLTAACTTFVTSTGSQGLRGMQGPASSGAEFVRFQSVAAEDGSVQSTVFSAANAVMLAAVVGLMAGMAPARAQDKADEAAAIAQAERAAPSKAERLKREAEKLANDKLTQERAQKVDPTSAPGSTAAAVFSSKTPKRIAVKSEEEKVAEKKKAVSAASPTAVPGKNKVIFSPADDLDEDELNPVRSGQGLLLAAYIMSLPSIYIFFWVAGSLNII